MNNILTALVFISGLSIGSFLNVVIDRLSEGKTLLGRSMCDYCERVLQPIELVPVLSWVVQKGYSRCCGKKLAWQYPGVELITGVAFVLVWMQVFMRTGNIVSTIGMWGIVSSLIVITIADLKYHIIPDAALASLALFGTIWIKTVAFQDRVLAAGVLFGGMALLYAATRGRGLGFGDVKFAGVIGYLLGLQQGFIALYIAFITGGIIAIFLLLTTKKGLKSEVAFGPFMVWGMVAVALFGAHIQKLIPQLFF